MKKFLAILLAVGICFAFTACGEEEKERSSRKSKDVSELASAIDKAIDSEKGIECPDFVGQSVEEIDSNEEYNQDFNLNYEWECNADYEYGTVYNQSVKAGKRLKKGNEITLYVSMGKKFSGNYSDSSQSPEYIYDNTSADTMKIFVGSAESKNGEIVSIPIRIDSNPGFMISLFDINYDNTVLEYISYEEGDIISDYRFSENDGYLRFLNAENNDVTDEGTMFTLKFKVIGESGESSVIDIEVNDIINYNEEHISYETEIGMVTVK